MPDYYKTVLLSEYASLAFALADISGGGTLVVDRPHTLPAGDSTIPRNVVLQFTGTGAFHVPTSRPPSTLTVQGEIVGAGRVVRFTGPGDVFLPGAIVVYPEWLGAVRGDPDCAPALRRALAASGANGPPVSLRNTSDGAAYHLASEVEVGQEGQAVVCEDGRAGLVASTPGMRSLLQLNANHVRVSRLAFEGARKAMHGLWVRRSYFSEVHEVIVGSTLSDGIHLPAGEDDAPQRGNNDNCRVTRPLFFYCGTFYVTPTSRARYDQPFATAGGGGPPVLVPIGTDRSHPHAAYVTPGQITELPAGTTARTTAGSPVVKIEGPSKGAKGDLDLTTLGLRRGDPIAVGNGAGNYASPLAAASYAHAIVASVDSPAELTCFRPFDVSVATGALAIGRGDSYHEARFNDNNLVDIQGARSVYSAGHAFASDGLFGASASDLWCDYGPFSAIRVGGAVLGDTVVGARIAKVYVEGSAGVLSYASGHVLTLGEVLGLEVTGSLDVGVPVPFVFHAGGTLGNGEYVVAEDYSTGSYSCASGIRRIGRVPYTSEIPLSAAVHAGPPPGPAFAVGAPGGPAYLNGWTAYGEGFTTVMGRIALGRVFLDGMMKPGVVGAPTFQLPVGFRPAQQQIIRVATTAGAGFAFVSAEGTVAVDASGTAWVGFSGASFPLV